MDVSGSVGVLSGCNHRTHRARADNHQSSAALRLLRRSQCGNHAGDVDGIERQDDVDLGAFQTVTLWSLPPVCRAVSLKRASPMVGMETFSGAFAGREVHLYDSGTTALTVALLDARMRHGSSHPEAIVPAY